MNITEKIKILEERLQKLFSYEKENYSIHQLKMHDLE